MSTDQIQYVSVKRDSEHSYLLFSPLVDIDNSNIMAMFAEARAAALELDPELQCNRITDFSGVRAQVDYQFWERASSEQELFNQKSSADLRFAIVAPEHLEFGQARTFYGLMEVPQEVRVFRHLDEARQWIEKTDRR